jgi:hypothetical protein
MIDFESIQTSFCPSKVGSMEAPEAPSLAVCAMLRDSLSAPQKKAED